MEKKPIKKCKGKLCAHCYSCRYFEDKGYEEGWCTIGPKLVARDKSACDLYGPQF